MVTSHCCLALYWESSSTHTVLEPQTAAILRILRENWGCKEWAAPGCGVLLVIFILILDFSVFLTFSRKITAGEDFRGHCSSQEW